MKKEKLYFVFFICFVFTLNSLFSQTGVSINNSGTTPDNSAILDVSSTSQGVLIPRMTEAERDAIVNPAEGLMLFNTSSRCFNTYMYGAWYEMCPECIGQSGLADFTISKDSAEAGESITFTSSNTTGDYYFWTFSGANPGFYEGQNPSNIKFSSPPGWKYMWQHVTKNGCTTTKRDSIYVKPIYNCTQNEQIFIVPAGITTITVEAWGAQGGSGGSGQGGMGGHVKGDLDVTPGDTLYVYVGGQGGWFGGNSYNGGGYNFGGGASDVRYGGNTYADRVIVAGGGGGGGYSNGINGGNAGGLVGTDGMDYGSQIKGTGGTQVAGGLGGWGSGYSGSGGPGGDGTLGEGGDWGCVGGSWAGAGGGGYYGGGSGGCGDHNSYGASGGGGSSYVGGVYNTTMYSSDRTGDGKVIISW